MSLGVWFLSVCAGAAGGLLAGSVGGNWSDAIGPGGITAGIVALAGGTIFKGDDTTAGPSFLVSIPLAGWLGGIVAAFWVDAGYFGALVGGGAGATIGWILGTLAFSQSLVKLSDTNEKFKASTATSQPSRYDDSVMGFQLDLSSVKNDLGPPKIKNIEKELEPKSHPAVPLAFGQRDSILHSEYRNIGELEANETAEPETNRKARALVAIEYDPDAAAAWQDIQELPKEYHSRFLQKLGEHPTQDAQKLANSLKKERNSQAPPR